MECVAGNLRDPEFCEQIVAGCDAVVHLGAMLLFGSDDHNPALFEDNLRGTFNMLQAAARRAPNLTRFVFASSDEVYPSLHATYLPIDEAHPKRPASFYGVTKLTGEELVQYFLRANGVPGAIARFSLTLEPWEALRPDRPLGSFLHLRPMIGFVRARAGEAAAADLEARLDPGSEQLFLPRDAQGRPWLFHCCDVRDLVQGLTLLLEKPAAVGEAFNLAGPLRSPSTRSCRSWPSARGSPWWRRRLTDRRCALPSAQPRRAGCSATRPSTMSSEPSMTRSPVGGKTDGRCRAIRRSTKPAQGWVDSHAGRGPRPWLTPSWIELRDMARVADDVGFSSIWISDHLIHIFPDLPPYGIWECWSVVSALAASTTRVQIGTWVMSTGFRNPALLAKMAETADEISGGRIILGLGAGWHEPEYKAFGFPYEPRVARFEESIAIIRGLLHNGYVDFSGKYYEARDCELRPRGPRPRGLPIMIGTIAGTPLARRLKATNPSTRMLNLVARYADIWNCPWVNRPEEIPAARETVDVACRAAGRDPSTLARTNGVMVNLEGWEARPATRPSGFRAPISDRSKARLSTCHGAARLCG